MNKASKFLGIVFLLLCSAGFAHGTQRKASLTATDREEWRKILKWPNRCEQNFKSTYQIDFPDEAGLEFFSLTKTEYLVQVFCSNNTVMFMNYDEATSVVRLLKFPGFGRNSRAEISFFLTTFGKQTKTLEIQSRRAKASNRCLFAQYRFVKGNPKLLKRRFDECEPNGPLGSFHSRATVSIVSRQARN